MRSVRRLLARWQIVLGLIIVGAFAYVALAAPYLAPPDDPSNPSGLKRVGRATDQIPHPPSDAARFGTSAGQYDIYYSIVWGTRSAFRFGLTVTLITAVFGVLLGALSGYVGGLFGGVVMRITDALLAFPVIAGVVLFQQLGRPANVTQLLNPIASLYDLLQIDPLMLALIVFSWMPYARLTHASALVVKQADFIQASKALGAGTFRMLFKHVLPNTVTAALVLAARDVGVFVILEAAFIFIGLAGSGEWGTLLAANRNWIIGVRGNPFTYWWVYVPPTIALILFGVGWNLLGDGLNDVLNPRQAN